MGSRHIRPDTGGERQDLDGMRWDLVAWCLIPNSHPVGIWSTDLLHATHLVYGTGSLGTTGLSKEPQPQLPTMQIPPKQYRFFVLDKLAELCMSLAVSTCMTHCTVATAQSSST